MHGETVKFDVTVVSIGIKQYEFYQQQQSDMFKAVSTELGR